MYSVDDSSANIEVVVLMAYTAASHQGATNLSIFIYGVWS